MCLLRSSAYASTQRMLDAVSTASGVLEEGLEHYRHAVLANYHRLKTVDNLYKWRGEILQRLDAIEADARAVEAAGCWYAEQLGVDVEEARDSVAADLRLLREMLPQLIDDLDARNAGFSGVALRKLMYLLRQDTRTKGQLQWIVDARWPATRRPTSSSTCAAASCSPRASSTRLRVGARAPSRSRWLGSIEHRRQHERPPAAVAPSLLPVHVT